MDFPFSLFDWEQPFTRVTGKSAGCPAGRKADPVIISTLPGSPALCLPVGRQGRGASFVTYPRVQNSVGHIDHKVHHHNYRGDEENNTLDNRKVPLTNGLKNEAANAG